MFAHQVIEDMLYGISETNPVWEDSQKMINVWKLLIPRIHSAQKFHMGDVDDVSKVVNIKAGSNLFMDAEFNDISRLPYKICWFDWTFKNAKNAIPIISGCDNYSSNTKEGVLVEEISKNIWAATTFTYFDALKRWHVPVCSFLIIIGGVTDDALGVLARFKVKYQAAFQPLKVNMAAIFYSDRIKGELAKTIVDECSFNFKLLYCALRIMKCKNISTEKIKAPVNLNKKRMKSSKMPIYDYHVLNVTLPSRKQEYRENSAPLSSNRVHLCRGHFKEYTSEHPLFGRLTGLYWWEPHVRGQNKDGIVMKDYAVKTTIERKAA